MDLVLWRHAEAHDVSDAAHADHSVAVAGDMARRLTPRGEKQASRMATWLDRHLPESARVLASPALRTEQTVIALGRKYKIRQELSPQGTVAQLLNLVQWPAAKGTVLVVGHQPVLGQVIAQLLGLNAEECSVKKGAVWWLRVKTVNNVLKTVVVTVQAPEVL